jgi:hypothetical protein
MSLYFIGYNVKIHLYNIRYNRELEKRKFKMKILIYQKKYF